MLPTAQRSDFRNEVDGKHCHIIIDIHIFYFLYLPTYLVQFLSQLIVSFLNLIAVFAQFITGRHILLFQWPSGI
jgi:hypothetical protein